MGWASRARRKSLVGEMCPGCAYRGGTAANQNGDGDVLLAEMRAALLEACAPFMCHDDRYRFEGSRVLCAGHCAAINVLAAKGYYDVPAEEMQRRGQVAVEIARRRDDLYQRESAAAYLEGSTR